MVVQVWYNSTPNQSILGQDEIVSLDGGAYVTWSLQARCHEREMPPLFGIGFEKKDTNLEKKTHSSVPLAHASAAQEIGSA